MNKSIKICLTLFLLLVSFASGFMAGQLYKPSTPSVTHLPLYDVITAIKNDLLVNITDPEFPNDAVRECEFYELREEDSGDYFQTTVDYWVFQTGQQTDGDIDAWVEIYNKPDNSTVFYVEVARNCWHEITISYKGEVKAVFPPVDLNDVVFPGYLTFEVVV